MLNFEQIINLTEYSGSSTPLYTESLMFAQEPNGTLGQFYINSDRTSGKTAPVSYGQYESLHWGIPYTPMTSQRVSRIGIKSFPQIGTMGFYSMLDEERSSIFCPVFVAKQRFERPAFSVIQHEEALTFVLGAPEDIEYECYRVVMRNGAQAFEYVTYENTLTVPNPYIVGDYECYAVGYAGEGEAVSDDSLMVNVTISVPGENPVGPFVSAEDVQRQLDSTADHIAYILTGEITAKCANLALGCITTAAIGDATIEAANIKDAAITRAKIKDAEVTSAKIADAAITSAKVDDAAITKAKIAVAAIEDAHIAEGAISSAKIHDGAVTNAKIADASITDAKIESLNADKITAGTIKTERLILVDNETGDMSVIKAINKAAGGKSDEEASGTQLDGAAIIDKTIEAAKIDVADLNAFEATIGGFNIDSASIHSKKNSIDDPTAGVYVGLTGLGLGDGALAGIDKSPFRVYADGTWEVEGHNASLFFDPILGTITINATELQVGSEEVLVQSDLTSVSTELANYITATNKAIEAMQGQIDGSIMTWFYDYEPGVANAPANAWSSATDKTLHLGDLFYDTTTGYCYRWMVQDDVYSWVKITDTDVTKALSDAANAQDTADSKRRVFYENPVPPYDMGDLWVQGAGGDLMVCVTAQPTGAAFVASNWELATKYTDDTQAQTALSMATEAAENAAEAQRIADTAQDKADAAQAAANTAASDAATAQQNATDAANRAAAAQSAADASAADAQAAQQKADTAASDAATAQATANAAVSSAAAAQSVADQARTEANKAAADASASAAEAATASTAASNAAAAAADASEKAKDAQDAAAAAQKTADDTAADLAAAQSNLNEVVGRVGATEEEVAKAIEDLAAAQAAADAAQAAADAADAAAAGAVSDAAAAQAAAQAAQSKAEAANSAAATAQSKADDAALVASGAQTAADNAAQAAAAAQGTADTAKANAQTAQDAADMAKANAKTAQDTADVAKANAQTAQNTADTAKANAQTAQNTADTAKANAQTAQNTADAAKSAADAAQDAVDALTGRVTVAETNIEKNAEAITLCATKVEVTETLGGYYTKSETEAKIQTSADSITSTVSSTYTTKDEFNSLEIGGRNLLLNSGGEFNIVKATQIIDLSEYGKEAVVNGATVAISFDAKADVDTCIIDAYPRTSEAYTSLSQTFAITSTWARYSALFDISANAWVAWTIRSSDNVSGGSATANVAIKNVKLELGNKATDWTPAPEDVESDIQTVGTSAQESVDRVDGRVNEARSEIEQLSTSISNLVVDKNGQTLMTQTASGWVFSTETIDAALGTAADAISSLETAVGDWNMEGTVTSSIKSLLSVVGDHGDTLNWVTIGEIDIDGDGSTEPCIELGESDSDYKLVITNKAIYFREGSSLPTWIQNNTLVTNNVEVKNELRQTHPNTAGYWVWVVRSNGNYGLTWKEA